MKKTVLWDDCKKDICTQALRILAPPEKDFSPSNFVEFISSCSNVSKKAMMSFLKANLDKNCFLDVSKEVYQKENECLFMAGKDHSSAIEIILRYLRSSNSRINAEAVWCFLDFEKKAVVHFVNRDGWFAEVYFLSDVNFSAIHVLESESYSLFIPVVFTTDLSDVARNVSLRGDTFLQDYLPSETGDLLSKKSCKKSVVTEVKQVNSGYDKGDCL